MRWHLQRKRSRTNDQGHVYCEAMIVGRPDGKRPTVSLGFLADHEIAFVKEAMATAPTALFTVSKAAQKTYLLDATTWPEIEREFEKLEAEARRQQALVAATLTGQRQYAAMTLRQFYDQVWSPYSQHTEPSTWKREDASRWPHILAHLGHVLLRDLDEMRWVRFLGSMTTWGPNSRRLAQVTYKKLLAKAVDCKAIPEVHPLPRTSRKTIRKVTPLLPHEVVGIIEHADSLLHQALFALAFGHGTRAGEPGLQRWERQGHEPRVETPIRARADLGKQVADSLHIVRVEPAGPQASEEARLSVPLGIDAFDQVLDRHVVLQRGCSPSQAITTPTPQAWTSPLPAVR